MKLASLPGNRDGQLIVVSKDNRKAVRVPDFSMRKALESWKTAGPMLHQISDSLNAGKRAEAFELNLDTCIAPLPHAPGFYDGSAFLSHVMRARKSRGDTMPESAKTTPLMYQGVSDYFLPATSKIEIIDESFGGDFEAEFAVVTDDVPRGTKANDMDPHLVLFGFFNDITLREILKTEIQTKFGFLQSKPNSSFAPLLVTKDEFGSHFKNGRIYLDTEVHLNGKLFGNPNGGEMHFSFGDLVAHACRTRPLSAGNIIGTGTVSNEDKARGFACLTEKRYQEMIDHGGQASTPWFKVGDKLSMDVKISGVSVFGPIIQTVTL